MQDRGNPDKGVAIQLVEALRCPTAVRLTVNEAAGADRTPNHRLEAAIGRLKRVADFDYLRYDVAGKPEALVVRLALLEEVAPQAREGPGGCGTS